MRKNVGENEFPLKLIRMAFSTFRAVWTPYYGLLTNF